jgi:hypothetical protein
LKDNKLTTTDHLVCGIFALLIYFSLKLATSPIFLVTITGWMSIGINILAFDSYGLRRRRDIKNNGKKK